MQNVATLNGALTNKFDFKFNFDLDLLAPCQASYTIFLLKIIFIAIC